MPPKPATRRYEDIKLLYDLDLNNRTRIVRQRVYKTEDGTIQTPITPLADARKQSSQLKAPVALEFKPRNVSACFSNVANESGVTNLTVIVPYAPTDSNLKAHVREILDVVSVESGFYTGELHDKSIKAFYKP